MSAQRRLADQVNDLSNALDALILASERLTIALSGATRIHQDNQAKHAATMHELALVKATVKALKDTLAFEGGAR